MEVNFTVPVGSIILPIPNLITLESLYFIDSAGDKKFITTCTDKEFKSTFPEARKGALVTKEMIPEIKVAFSSYTATFADINPKSLGFIAGMSVQLSGVTGVDGIYVISEVTDTQLIMTTEFPYTASSQLCNLAGYFGEKGTPTYARYTGLNTSGQSIVQQGNIGIYFNIPFSEEVTLFVEGLYLDSLIEDTDESYWSIKAPMLLLASSAWFLEMTFRNTAGMNDWNNAILLMKEKIEAQYSELTVREIDQMEEAY